MPKNSESRNENRGGPSMGNGGQKGGREEGGGSRNDNRQQGRQEGTVNLKDYHQNQGREVGGGNLKDAQQQSQGQRLGNASGLGGFRKMFQGNRAGGGNTASNGCFPKLFMLFLPLITVGTYLFFRS